MPTKITEIYGNLLSAKQGYIVHCANSRGVMGSGVALAIKNAYPGAYQHYLNEYAATGLALGTNNIFSVSDTLVIVNAIGQEDFGSGRRFVSYDAIADCFEELNTLVKFSSCPKELHIPKLGAARAGGNWAIIKTIIEETMDYPVTLWLPDNTVTTL